MIVEEARGRADPSTPAMAAGTAGRARWSLVAVASAALGLLLIGVMLAYAGYGYDFTDEGFYLVRISDPFADAPAVSQFGIVYYPFYRLLGGSIAGLRQFNLLATFFGAAYLCAIAIRQQGRQISGPTLLLVSVGIASTSLLFIFWFLVTPNYNSLALQGLIVAATGLLLAQRKACPASIAGWLLTGFGGWLVFLAKPSSAAILAVLAVIYLAMMRKLRLPLVLLAIGFALLLLLGTAFVVDGSVAGFVERIRGGVERLALLEVRTTSKIVRWDSFAPNRVEKLLIWTLSLWTLVMLGLTVTSNALARVLGQAMAVAAGVIGALVLLGCVATPLRDTSSQAMIVYGPLLGLLVFLPLMRFVRWRREGDIAPLRWPPIFLLFLLPFAYSFGTGNNYWNTAPAAALFWGIAGGVLLVPGRGRIGEAAMLPAWAIVYQLPAVIVLATGLQWPYRQPEPVRSFDGVAKVGVAGSGLVMPRGFAIYLDKMRKILDTHGFTVGDPIIDLSGQSPGVLFAVGASNMGQPWMIGGYPGSEKLARKVLARESCEALARSWILAEPAGPISISTDVVAASGLPFPGSYEIAGRLMTPAGGGGYAEARQEIVYRPTKPIADIVSACKASRG